MQPREIPIVPAWVVLARLGWKTCAIGACALYLASCVSANRRALEKLAAEDPVTRAEVLNEEVAKAPKNLELREELKNISRIIAEKRREQAKTLEDAGWSCGASLFYRAAFRASAYQSDTITSAAQSDMEAAFTQMKRARGEYAGLLCALEAAESARTERAIALLDGLAAQKVLFPDISGLANSVREEARSIPVAKLKDVGFDSENSGYKAFLQDMAQLDSSNRRISTHIKRFDQHARAQKLVDQALEQLDAKNYEDALDKLEEAKAADAGAADYQELESRIRNAWAFDLYNQAIPQIRRMTKKDWIAADELLRLIDTHILPGFRDTAYWRREVHRLLSETYMREARDCLRHPALRRIATGKAWLERALLWDKENQEARALLESSVNALEDMMTRTRLRVLVEGHSAWKGELQERLIQALRSKKITRMTIEPGAADEIGGQLSKKAASELKYAPSPALPETPWEVLELRLAIHADEAEREGDKISVAVSSERVKAGAGRTVTNPVQLQGKLGSERIQQVMQTTKSIGQDISQRYAQRQQEWERTKGEYEVALGAWEAANTRFETAQAEHEEAQRELHNAESALTTAQATLATANGTLALTPRSIYTPAGSMPNPMYRAAQVAATAAEFAEKTAQQRVATANSSLSVKSANLDMARQTEFGARTTRDSAKSVFDTADALFTQAKNVKQKWDEMGTALQEGLQEWSSKAAEPAVVEHEFWETYQYRTGMAALRARFFLRGCLRQLDGDVVLAAIQQDNSKVQSEEFRLEVDPNERLEVTAKGDSLPTVEVFLQNLRNDTERAVLEQVFPQLRDYHLRHLAEFDEALAQGRTADAIEEALRFLRYAEDAPHQRTAELKNFIAGQMLEVLP